MEYILIVLFGMLTGMAIGLLPVLPIYFGAFILYLFMGYLPPEHLIVFWVTALIGSQYFGSISTITLKIPGEASALVYINDIHKMSLSERASLLFTTAKGSFVAGLFALGFVLIALKFLDPRHILFFSSVNFQLIAFTFALLSFAFLNKNILITIALVTIGVILGPQNNYVLPESWYKLQQVFSGTTLFMIVLGMMVIPQMILYKGSPDETPNLDINKFGLLGKLRAIKNTVIGIVSGLIPGPAAELASTVAYRTEKGNTAQKVVAAETANNSAIVTLLTPFFILGIPFTASTIIFANIMDLKSVDIVQTIYSTSSVIPFMTVGETVLFTAAIVTLFYYFLATNFISIYAAIVHKLHSQMKTILTIIVILMATVDIVVSEAHVPTYLFLLTFFLGIGIILERKHINPIPFMFALLIGDKLIWVYVQFYQINFG